jgi:hypothetical protein
MKKPFTKQDDYNGWKEPAKKKVNHFVPWLKKLKNKQMTLHINSGQDRFDGDRTTYQGKIIMLDKDLIVFQEKGWIYIFPIDDIEKICVDSDDLTIRSNVKIKEIEA